MKQLIIVAAWFAVSLAFGSLFMICRTIGARVQKRNNLPEKIKDVDDEKA